MLSLDFKLHERNLNKHEVGCHVSKTEEHLVYLHHGNVLEAWFILFTACLACKFFIDPGRRYLRVVQEALANIDSLIVDILL